MNLIAIPYIMALCTSGFIFASTRMLFMLRDTNYFAV
jgi:MFS family permease